MKNQIIIYLCLSLCADGLGKDLRILGATDAKISDFPYYVSMRHIKENHLFCGGAIISHKHVMTAAHCTYIYQASFDDIRIYTVMYSPNDESSPYMTIDTVFIHPAFFTSFSSSYLHDSDISVIKIKETFQFGKYLRKIALPTQETAKNFDVTVIGLGADSYPDVNYPDKLKKTTMKIQDRQQCDIGVPFLLHSGQLCAFRAQGIGSCFGDSGGPLIYDNTLVGITSFSLPCAQGVPDIFTNVYYYLDYIEFVLKK